MYWLMCGQCGVWTVWCIGLMWTDVWTVWCMDSVVYGLMYGQCGVLTDVWTVWYIDCVAYSMCAIYRYKLENVTHRKIGPYK